MVPPELIARRDALIADIQTAFKGVSRTDGVSWSEAEALDGYPHNRMDPQQEREKDREKKWEDLVDDPAWDAETGICSEWSFLDSIGFRYYLPPAMIRNLRSGESESLCFHLTLHGVFHNSCLQSWQLFDAQQCRCVSAFILFMRDHSAAIDLDESNDWQRAYESYWHQFE